YPEKIEPKSVEGSELKSAAKKVGAKRVRVEVRNGSNHPVLLGDVVVGRGKPKDECTAGTPAAVVQPGESLVDVRPGLLSPSMKAWVAVFTGEKQCRWVQASP